MSDKNYSLDDILSEYSTYNSKKSECEDNLSLTGLLDEFDAEPKKSSVEPKVSLHNTDIFSKVDFKKAEAPKVATQVSVEKPARKEMKSPAKPYVKEASAAGSATAVKEREEEKMPDEIKPIALSNDEKLQSDSNQKQEISLDDILDEYKNEEKASKDKAHNKHIKGLTEFFTKLIPQTKTEENCQNEELLDGMTRMKKERLSRTFHQPIVERKSISDIDLKLDDKILPDTAQIPIDFHESEIDKISKLNERRSKKIKDFVLVGEEEDTDEVVSESDLSKTIDDYDSFEDASAIFSDIKQLKNNLIIRMIVLIFCGVISLYISVSNYYDFIPALEILDKSVETSVFLFVNAIIGLLASFTCFNVIKCGITKLLAFKADCDSLAAFSIFFAIIMSIVMFANTALVKGEENYIHIYVPSAIFLLIFNTIGKLLILSRTQRSFAFISGATDKYALFNIENKVKAEAFTRGTLRDFPTLSSMRKTEFITDFIKTTYASDSADKFSSIFTPIILVSSFVIGVIATILTWGLFGSDSIFIGLSVILGTVSLASSFSMMLVVNLPMERSSVKNYETNGAILGYEAVDEFCDTNSVLIDASELFPAGSVKLVNIKVFSDTRIDEAIVEAASLTSHSGSILKGMFYDIIAGKTELLNSVESYIFEDSLGLCGWINNKRVLLGNRELMINHSIDGVPTEKKEKDYTKNGRSAIYLSISGELSAMFIVELTASPEIQKALYGLQKKSVYTVIHTVDSLISITHLSEVFDVSPEFFKLLPFRYHADFDEETSYIPRQKALLACSGRFSSFVTLITSCKNIHSTIIGGIIIQSVAILLAILISLTMVIFRLFGDFSSLLVILYNLGFSAILLVYQLFRRN